jgi:hypothetical protein
MEAKDYFDLAQKLAQMRTEAAIRSAISRAYYALLNSAVQLLQQLGFRVEQGPGKHGEVYRRLFNSGIKQKNRFVVNFELRFARMKAKSDQ